MSGVYMHGVQLTLLGVILVIMLIVFNCAIQITFTVLTWGIRADSLTIKYVALAAGLFSVILGVVHVYIIIRSRKFKSSNKVANVWFLMSYITLGIVQFIVTDILIANHFKVIEEPLDIISPITLAYVASLLPALYLPIVIEGPLVEGPNSRQPPDWVRRMGVNDRIDPTWQSEHAERMERR